MLEFYYIERRLLKVVNNLYLFLLEQKTKEVAIILSAESRSMLPQKIENFNQGSLKCHFQPFPRVIFNKLIRRKMQCSSVVVYFTQL